MPDFDFKVATAEFKLRRQKHSKTPRIDNSSLHVGSPMYFYCKGCHIQHCTKPENYTSSAPKYCDACEPLAKHGMIARLIEEIKDIK